jgi:DNA repair protein RadC
MGELKTIDGVDYIEEARGILIPASLVREGSPKIRKPEDAMACLEKYRFEEQEHFLVITLDAQHTVIKTHLITKGLANQSQCHPREVFRVAILDNAIGIFVAHNHPSGSLDASVNDLLTTRRIAEAGKIMGIPLLDHLIISSEGFVSLQERFPDYFNPAGGKVEA